LRPPLSRSGLSTASLNHLQLHQNICEQQRACNSGLNYVEFDLELVMFRIDARDKVCGWKGKMQHTVQYADPEENSNIIRYWTDWNLDDVIEVYLTAKETRETQSITRPIDGRIYSWKFVPQKAQNQDMNGYILDATAFNTATSSEVTKQFNEMKTSLFRVFSHQIRTPIHQLAGQVQDIQSKLGILQAARRAPVTTDTGRLITFDMIVRELSGHGKKANGFIIMNITNLTKFFRERDATAYDGNFENLFTCRRLYHV
jgi:signal transduction histidine kinase